MNWRDMANSVEDAEQISINFNNFVDRLAKLLVGRLRNVSSYKVLESLKRELKDYNAKTGEWKN